MSRRVLVHMEAHQVHYAHPYKPGRLTTLCGHGPDTDFHDQPENLAYGRKWEVTCSECKNIQDSADQLEREMRADLEGVL